MFEASLHIRIRSVNRKKKSAKDSSNIQLVISSKQQIYLASSRTGSKGPGVLMHHEFQWNQLEQSLLQQIAQGKRRIIALCAQQFKAMIDACVQLWKKVNQNSWSVSLGTTLRDTREKIRKEKAVSVSSDWSKEKKKRSDDQLVIAIEDIIHEGQRTKFIEFNGSWTNRPRLTKAAAAEVSKNRGKQSEKKKEKGKSSCYIVTRRRYVKERN